jgi:hypothetical protein
VIPLEAVPLVAAFATWAFTMRLAAGVELERPDRDARDTGSAADRAAADVVVTTSPPLGHKVAQIIATGDRAWFAGVSHQVYGVEADATCRRAACSPPAAACTCGFYAYADEADAVDLGTRLSRHPVRYHALLEVELTGDVLTFDRGFRGARQRVLRVEVDPWCHRCAHRGRRRHAEALGADSRDRRRQLWCDARPRALASLPAGSAPIRPLCDRHLAGASRVLRPVDVAGLLGTEVRWRA